MRLLARPTAFAFTVAAVLGAVPTACGHDATSPTDQIAGRYTLRTVGTKPLPAEVYYDLGGEYFVLADTLTLRSDGTLTEQAITQTRGLGGFATNAPAPVATTLAGTWTRSGDSVYVQFSGNPAFGATFASGNTLTVDYGLDSGYFGLFVFQK